MALIVPSRLRSQPQWPAPINRSHPQGSKVTAAFAAHYGNGHVELIRGHTGSLIGTGLSGKAGVGGIGIVGTSSNGGYAYTSRNEFCPGAAPFSVELLYTNGAANAQFDRIWEAGPITQSGKGWDLELAGDGLGLNFTDSSGGTTLISAGTINTIEHVIVTLSGTKTLTSYQNGKVFQAATSVATGVNYTNTNSWLYAFSSSGHTPQGTKLQFIRFYQGTVLSAQDVRSLFSNPWDMFSPSAPIIANSVSAVSSTWLPRPPIKPKRRRTAKRRPVPGDGSIIAFLGRPTVWLPKLGPRLKKATLKKKRHFVTLDGGVISIIGRPTAWLPRSKMRPAKAKHGKSAAKAKGGGFGTSGGAVIAAVIEWIVRNRRRRRG